jgi:hypothetical protein
MTNQRQIDANRRNAQLSTGPRTPQGKAAVRYNGLRHGITARHAVLEGENPADFEETIRAFEDDLQPAGPDESVLVHRIADCWWRLRRLRQSETDYYQLRAPILQKDDKRFRALSPELRPSFIACCDADGFPTLKNFSLLESRLERSFYRALHELERRQALRAGFFVPPPVVAEINIDLKNQSQSPDPSPPPPSPSPVRSTDC